MIVIQQDAATELRKSWRSIYSFTSPSCVRSEGVELLWMAICRLLFLHTIIYCYQNLEFSPGH